ncbi:MAG: TRAP transporter substrate-binding protein [Methyloceanibacter sp.]|jgi:TRAP-type mannitol/chloroaromatic compound transport system substrate-binding protein
MRCAAFQALVAGGLWLALLAETIAAPAQTVTLETPVAYGTHVPGLGTPARDLARLLRERSDGAIQLELKEPGDGTAPFEILDKVSDGKVDAGFSTAGYWAAKLPAASLFSGYPFGPTAKEYRDWFNRGHGRALYQEMYDQAKVKVHVIPCAFGGAEAGGWFVDEITSVDDLDGLRIRIFGLGARVMMRLGAVPVLLPGSQIGEAFSEGKIDAAEAYTPAVDRANSLQDSAKILYQPGWIQPATVFEFLINKDRWDSLGPERQSLIERTCGEMLQKTLSASTNLQAAALTAFANQDSVRILSLPDDVEEALREGWKQVAEEEGVRDYLFKEVLEDIEAFRSGGVDGENAANPKVRKAEEAIPPPPPPGDATPVGP